MADDNKAFDVESKELIPVETTPVPIGPQKTRKEKREEKRKVGKVMSTGAFVGTFVLLLIPGVNILLIILWAIGAAKNRNKVNLSRGLIIFFLIEVLLALVLAGVGYIVADQKQDQVLKYLDTKSGGVVSYFEIKDYKDFTKLSKLSKYLVEKEKPEDKEAAEEEEEVVIPKVCYAYNPEGIASLEEFEELYEAQFAEPEDEDLDAEPVDETEEDAGYEEGSLFAILDAANVDVENSQYIYIILDNKKDSSVIVFD
ncbi:MAG: hypothetical protein Q4F70_05615, partial [Clostridia bacterium]|nr:hypothetical protein [Clostridia bacterium]